jgi:RNA polymerase sigma-70 factor (ECF subfamily)
VERAVFVLREAFDLPFSEIGQIIGREEAATRQLAHRAREHVRQRRPRFEVDRAARREMTERFLAACASGSVELVYDLLAEDVRLVSDGGGKAKAPLRVIAGRDKVSRFLTAISRPEAAQVFLASIGAGPAQVGYEITDVNAAPALVVTLAGRPLVVLSLLVREGLIDSIFLMANPDKLVGVSRTTGPGASRRA